MKEFTKQDLQTGMWIKNRKGKWSMVLLNTANGNIISGDSWCPIDSFNNDLTYYNVFHNEEDIIKVVQPRCNSKFLNFDPNNTYDYEILWERTK